MEALPQVKGAYSLVVLTRDKLIAARDPMGFRPLCLGRFQDSYVVASAKPLRAPASVDLRHVPERHLQALAAMLQEPIALEKQLLDYGQIKTDMRNTILNDIAASQLAYRRLVVKAVPAAFLVN